MKKTAICYFTHKWDETVNKIFYDLYNAVKDRKEIDVWVLYDVTDKDKDEEAENINYDLDYVHFVNMYDKWEEPYFYTCHQQISIWKADNCNMLFYDFVEKHQEYNYYITFENDLMFNGDFNLVLDTVPYKKFDILFQYNIQSIIGEEHWRHYKWLNIPYKKEDIRHCLQHIVIVKREAINKILNTIRDFERQDENYNCFYEISIPTIAYNLKMKIGNIMTWFNVRAYASQKHFDKIMDVFKYDVPNTFLHPVKTMKDYQFIKDNTTDVGNMRRL